MICAVMHAGKRGVRQEAPSSSTGDVTRLPDSAEATLQAWARR